MEQRLKALVRFLLKQGATTILFDQSDLYLFKDLNYYKIKSCKDDEELLSFCFSLAGLDSGKPESQSGNFFLEVDGVKRYLNLQGNLKERSAVLMLREMPCMS